eukprot:403352454
MAFRNDTRGVGGQKEVMNLMQNHYSALVNVKSTLNTRQAPRQHVSKISTTKRPSSAVPGHKKLEQDLIKAQNFAEQRETFKRISNIKSGGTDSKPPTTFKLGQKLSTNKIARANNYQHEEHLKNLASLQSRINFVGSKLDRKKNPHDPLSNPVFFFKKDEKDKKTSLTDFAKKVENNLEKRQEKNKKCWK